MQVFHLILEFVGENLWDVFVVWLCRGGKSMTSEEISTGLLKARRFLSLNWKWECSQCFTLCLVFCRRVDLFRSRVNGHIKRVQRCRRRNVAGVGRSRRGRRLRRPSLRSLTSLPLPNMSSKESSISVSTMAVFCISSSGRTTRWVQLQSLNFSTSPQWVQSILVCEAINEPRALEQFVLSVRQKTRM